ncbi:hypothetical protein SAY87_009055 [Trapa incisa]|uniref:Uncharacterized protein n=1 Tax=Trapa incisa TaxID=236973 RepID=A0AAN7PX71_9MYRT|nr:hypothetical protein SAY87_009055 [Trapa incisa]
MERKERRSPASATHSSFDFIPVFPSPFILSVSFTSLSQPPSNLPVSTYNQIPLSLAMSRVLKEQKAGREIEGVDVDGGRPGRAERGQVKRHSGLTERG